MIFDTLKSDSKIKEVGSKAIFIVSIASIVVGMAILIWFFANLWDNYDIISKNQIDLETTAHVGDYVGGVVGSIWSLSGVLLFFLALRLQSKEIAIQINELRETKEVFRSQQFESTFFNLLKVQHELINNLKAIVPKYDVTSSGFELKAREGRDFFRITKSEMRFIYKFLEHKTYTDKSRDFKEMELYKRGHYYKITLEDWTNFQQQKSELEKSKITYRIFFEKFHFLIGHYFRHLFHTLKFVNDRLEEESQRSGLTETEKTQIRKKYHQYAAFIQAQMSAPELFLLFYNALCYPKTYELVEKFKLLENLSYEDLIKEDHKTLYKQKIKSRKETLA